MRDYKAITQNSSPYDELLLLMVAKTQAYTVFTTDV
jgi:hypothetical protein